MGTANSCCRPGVLYSDSSKLRAENSIFGWTVGGTADAKTKGKNTEAVCLKATPYEEDLTDLLQRYWATERLAGEQETLTPEEHQAVTHFEETTTRDADGRYRVSLPRKTPTPELGRSRRTAERRYLSNERSLRRQGIWDVYSRVVNEYEQMEHTESVPVEDLGKPTSDCYYLPMHGVAKESSSTTKLRAVCDASAKTSTGVSLNNQLLPGPNL